jgi:hypothetical protein
VAFALAYAGLGLALQAWAPRLYVELDQAFDADLGSWIVDLARPQGPHSRTAVHPLSVLLLNPAGSGIREVLRALGVPFAARFAASLLCALAGGAAVGAFRLLLDRLGVPRPRARLFTLVFALSASQLFFASVPESYAFSALSLVVVFLVAAGPRPAPWARVAAGVASFGVTVTNVVAVALARASGEDARRPAVTLAAVSRHVALVLAIAAALAVVQRGLYPTAELWFLPRGYTESHTGSIHWPGGPRETALRAARVVSHMAFGSLAAPRLAQKHRSATRTPANFPAVAIRDPRPAGAAHAVLWSVLLAAAGLGLWRRPAPPIAWALVAWLAFEALLHLHFGASLFLYSGHWTFALVAVVAAFVGTGGGRALTLLLAAVVGLQAVANAGLVLDLVRLFANP